MTTALESDLAREADAIRDKPRLIRYWWVLRHHDRPVQFVIGRVLMATGLSPFMRIRQDGFDLRFYDSSISLELWLHPRATPNPTALLFRRYLRPGDTVVDVGANIGFYALTCSTAVGDAGRVIAVEPDPRIAGFLRGNVGLNARRNIDVHNVALGAESGWLCFSNEHQDDRNCVVADGQGRRVEVVRLDAVPVPPGEVALLKIDVEGYEKFVLDGATALLPRVQCLFIEMWAEHFARYGYTCRDVHERLVNSGLRLFRAGDGTLTPVETGEESTTIEDIVAIRDVDRFVGRTGLQLRR